MKIQFNRSLLFYNSFRRFVCFPTLYFIYNFKLTGRENLPKEGPAFILSKHWEWIDLFVICYASKVPLYYVAKQELFGNIFGDFPGTWLFRLGEILKGIFCRGLYWMGAIPLSRDNPKETVTSFKYMEKLLSEKEIIVFFPEGRMIRNNMGEAKSGLIKWVMKLQDKKKCSFPVVTMGINYKWVFPRVNITCNISPPEFYDSGDPLVTEKIMEKIKKLSNL